MAAERALPEEDYLGKGIEGNPFPIGVYRNSSAYAWRVRWKQEIALL